MIISQVSYRTNGPLVFFFFFNFGDSSFLVRANIDCEIYQRIDMLLCSFYVSLKYHSYILCFSPIDVGNWKEGGGRGAMQQPSPSKDPPSPQSSSQQNPIETQQNGPPTPVTGADTPSPQMQQPMGLRPGGGPMHMGPPPMGIPPQYRGMMPPYVSSLVF